MMVGSTLCMCPHVVKSCQIIYILWNDLILSMVFSVLLFTEMGEGLLCEFWRILSLMIGEVPEINKL